MSNWQKNCYWKMDSVKKYLDKYGLTNWTLDFIPAKKFNTIVVVPVLAEFENISILLKSLANNDYEYCKSTLILFVINNLKSSSDDAKSDNRKTIALLRKIINIDNSEVSELINISGLTLNFIDASSEGKELPEKEGGVGLARKIGMDMALTLFDYQSSNKKILICLDADCTVSPNYLYEIIKNFNKNNLNAAVVEFHHTIDDNNNSEAIVCYEIFLRYYLLGLKYSESPYAFHTIGSTMMCDYESYIKVEGMNKKKAAEDFYFLEKLAKHVNIAQIKYAFVYPSSRGSWRVPFGTGQRVNRFLSNVQNEYLLYHPDSFIVLKKWLQVFNHLNNEKEVLNEAKSISYSLYEFLLLNKFEESLVRIKTNSKTLKQIDLQKRRWFDGFKTLKLIHHLRDTEFPLKPMFDTLDRFFHLYGITHSIKRNNSVPSLSIQKEYLGMLRNII